MVSLGWSIGKRGRFRDASGIFHLVITDGESAVAACSRKRRLRGQLAAAPSGYACLTCSRIGAKLGVSKDLFQAGERVGLTNDPLDTDEMVYGVVLERVDGRGPERYRVRFADKNDNPTIETVVVKKLVKLT